MVSFGSSLLHAGNASNALSVAVVATLAIALGICWLGALWASFLLIATSWVLAETSRLLRSAERHALGQLPPAIPRADALVWLVDAALVALILADTSVYFGQPMVSWLAPPAMLVLLVALMPRVVRGMPSLWMNDRFVLGVLLAIASVAGQLLPAVQLISIGLVVAGLVLPARSRG